MGARKVLIVEDDEITAIDLKYRLEWLGYDVVAVGVSASEAMGHVDALDPDIVLMDIALQGEMDGIDAALVIYKKSGTPIIFLTATVDDDTIRRATAVVPYGFLTKPFNARELHAAIQIAVSRREAELALEVGRVQIQHLALHDAATGLPNRSLFNDRLDQTILRAIRTEKSFTLAYVDLDGFKGVNDTYGHSVADDVLVEVASRLKISIRKSDTAARLGGDEFVIILCDMAEKVHATRFAEKILRVLSVPISIGEEKTLSISASVGLAMYPANGSDKDILVKAADTAMYAAKNSGRNCFRFFSG